MQDLIPTVDVINDAPHQRNVLIPIRLPHARSEAATEIQLETRRSIRARVPKERAHVRKGTTRLIRSTVFRAVAALRTDQSSAPSSLRAWPD